ncbi:MAG: enoyl-CoA hydratase/isomerase family protein [Caulobacterales bacterium]
MSALTEIRFERNGPLATITFARPQVLNALSPTLIEETLNTISTIAESDARVLILRGEGKSFSAGVDLNAAQAQTREKAREFSENARKLIILLETMPQVVIARVTGHCFTGGLEVALGADVILCTEDSIFADTHGKIGLRPGWGLSQRLPRRIGQQRAREMSFTGRRINGVEAAAIGLVLEALPIDKLDARIDELATQIIANSGGAIAAYKALYRAAETHTLDEGLAYETNTRFKISDAKERMSTAPVTKK